MTVKTLTYIHELLVEDANTKKEHYAVALKAQIENRES